jgi:hypothetical protein
MADQLLYEVSNSVEMDGEPFTRRENVYIIDQNNGSYSNNTILLDCASVSNAGKWADFANATIAVPLTLSLSSTYNFSAIASDFALGLKNGFHQIVSSLNVEYNNSSVVQISNFTNMYISYKLNTTLSVDDVVTIGSQIGFAYDSEGSWIYGNGTSIVGMGSINNSDNFLETNYSVAFKGMSGNLGFGKRQLNTTFTSGQTGVSTLLGVNWFSVSATYARNYSIKGLSGLYYYQCWYILATLRLKDLADFFAQMPLVRNSYMKLYINLNQSRVIFSCLGSTDGALGKLSVSPANIIISGGNTNPVMVASANTDCGFLALKTAIVASAVDVPFLASVGVGSSLDPNIPSGVAKNPMLSSCRLYIDLYTMNPLREEQYLMNRTKTIKFRDIFQYQFLNVSSSFNFLVSNGISNLKELIVCPFISSTYNGTGVQATAFSTLASPFATEPATCSPCMWFNNINFQISGVNIFSNNEQYGFEQYQNELYGVGSINGGLTDGLTSGLISQQAYLNNYGYLVANVGRRLPEDDRTPKSVQVSGTCLSVIPIDLYVFCVFEKEIVIDTYSGKRIA